MNTIYRIVWNTETGQWVVASEFAKGRKKASRTAKMMLASAATLLVSIGASGSAMAANGIFINDGTDGSCSHVSDAATPTLTTVASSACSMTDAATQTTRALFFGPTGGPGSDSLSLGGELYVNSGRLVLNDRVTGKRALMIGDTVTSATGDEAIAIGNRSTASGGWAIAVGPDANAATWGDTAIGASSAANGGTSGGTALGVKTNALAANAVALGNEVTVRGAGGIAIVGGTAADYTAFDAIDATSSNAIVMGTSARATAANSGIAIGTLSQSSATNAVALGYDAKSSQINTVAVGAGTKASAEYASAVGNSARALSVSSVALGSGAEAGQTRLAGTAAIAIGELAKAQGARATAIGQLSETDAVSADAIAIGTSAKAIGSPYGLAMGAGANAIGSGSIAFGYKAGSGTVASASTHDNFAMGTSAGQTVVGSYNQAQGVNSGQKVTGDNNIAIGHGAGNGVTASNTTAIGLVAQAASADAVAIGTRSAVENAASGIAIGVDASVVNASGGIAIGDNALALRTGGVALGEASRAAGATSTAIGSQTQANKDDSLALGNQVIVNAVGGIGLGGTGVTVEAVDVNSSYAVAIGGNAKAVNSSTSVALGFSAENNNTANGVAIGYKASAKSLVPGTTILNAVAIGSAATANASHSTAVGSGAAATGANSIAMGRGAQANALNTISIGTGNIVNGVNSGAIGDPSIINGTDSYSVGNNNTIAAGQSDVFAFGNNITSTVTNSVVLGSSSAATSAGTASSAGTTAYSRETINGNTYSYAGGVPVGVVSVGSVGSERRVQNVAAGLVASGSTDAINGSQLFATNQAIADAQTHYYSVNDGGIQRNNYNNDGATGANSLAAGANAAATASGSVAIGSAADASANDTVSIGRNTEATADMSTAVGAESRADAYGSVAVGFAYAGGEEASAFGYSAVATGTNSLAAGANAEAIYEADTAVGYSATAWGGQSTAIGSLAQSSGLASTAVGSDAFAGGADSTALGSMTWAEADGGVALGSESYALRAGMGTTGARERFSNTAIASTKGAVSVGQIGLERQITNVAGGTEATDAVNVRQLQAVADTAMTFAGNSGSVDKKLGQTLAIQGVGSTSGTYSGNNLRTEVDANGVLQLQMAESPKFGTVTINDGGTGKITGVANGEADTDAVNMSQLNEVNATASAGWNISAQGANGTNVAPGESVDLSNIDGNIVVAKSTADDNVTFDLADDLTIGGSITVGDTYIDGTSVTTTNLTATGDTYLGDNFSVVNNEAHYDGPITGDTSIVNKQYVDQSITQVVDTPITFAGNSGSVAKKLGETMAIQGVGSTTGEYSGNNLKTEVDANGVLQLQMAESPKFGTVTINDGGTGKISGVANGEADTDAVNMSQLNEVNATASAGWNISAQGANGTNVAPGESVDLSNTDGNIVVAKSTADDNVTFDLADDLTIGGSITVGDTYIDGTSVTTTNLTATGDTYLGDNFSVVNNEAHYDGPITGDTSIVNKQYVDQSITQVVDTPITFAGNSGSVAKKLGETMAIQGVGSTTGEYSGNNLKTEVDANGVLQLQMAESPKFGTVTINDGGTGKITGVANGEADTDAVNMSQLNEVNATASAGWNISAQGANGTNVAPGESVDLSNTDGNIVVAKSTADDNVTFDLADDLTIGGSITVGDTYIDGTSVTTTNLTATGDTYLGDNFSVVNNEAHYDGPITGDTSIVNKQYVDQSMTQVVDTPITFAGNSGSVAKKLGETMAIQGVGSTTGEYSGNNLKTEVDANGVLQLQMAESPKFGTVTINDGGTGKISGVANGEVSAASEEAINGSQLYAVSDSIVDHLGGDATVNPDGTITGPTYKIQGDTYTTVYNAFEAMDNELTTINNTLTTISSGGGIKYFHANSTAADSVAAGAESVAIGPNAVATNANSVAMGNGAAANHDNSVALGAGSVTTVGAQSGYQGAYVGPSNSTGEVNVGGRQITGVAAGSAATDAVNVSQLQAGVNYAITEANNYTDTKIGEVKTSIENLDNRVTNIEGSIGEVATNVTNLDNRVTNVEGDVSSIQAGASGMFQVSQEDNTVAPAPTGADSAAGGAGAVASGDRSTAVGNGATASGNNSVALGNGSVADADNTVSVGSVGNERTITNVKAGEKDTDAVNVSQLKEYTSSGVQYDKNPDGTTNYSSVTLAGGRDGPTTIHNVAAGTAPTDAVNVGQLQSGLTNVLNQANSYTDNRISQLQDDMWSIDRGYRGATASAMAMAGLPQAYLPGKNMLSVSAGGYQGEYGMAIGLSGVTDNGRWVYKGQASGNTTRDWGFSVGAGIQW
ncbi:YadA-like family protein [Lysobacter sp. FW306-1B-D06B]|uniref:YadA-like family protein n=1 Tax=Lysobacter sp. FW306-1B-D06B TaxID=3140250 RepID=UPI00314047B1